MVTGIHCIRQWKLCSFASAFSSSGYTSATLTKSQLRETSDFADVTIHNSVAEEKEEEVRRLEKEEEIRRMEEEEEIGRMEEGREGDDGEAVSVGLLLVTPEANGEVLTIANDNVREEEGEQKEEEEDGKIESEVMEPEVASKSDMEEATGEIAKAELTGEQLSLDSPAPKEEEKNAEPSGSPEQERHPGLESSRPQEDGDEHEEAVVPITITTIVTDVDCDPKSDLPPHPIVSTDEPAEHESGDKEV